MRKAALYVQGRRHLGHGPDYILDLIKERSHVDWFLTAKEAKKHKIANHLKIPRLKFLLISGSGRRGTWTVSNLLPIQN